MEITGVIASRPILNFLGTRINTQPSNYHPVSSTLPFSDMLHDRSGKSGVKMAVRTRGVEALSNSRYLDSAHLEYYNISAKMKEEVCDVKKVKKKLKLTKRFCKDISRVSDLDFLGGELGNRLVDEEIGKIVTEATEILQTQLERMETARKELKRNKKLQRKATLLKSKSKKSDSSSSSSSSSSSESSDSDCQKPTNLPILKHSQSAQSQDYNPEQPIKESTLTKDKPKTEEATLQTIEQQNCTEITKSFESGINCENGFKGEKGTSRVEICMGGKCKKMGSIALLEEFEKKIGEHGVVVGCKCMGKCKNGPNVKITNLSSAENKADQTENTFVNPLFIGVGLEDVGELAAKI